MTRIIGTHSSSLVRSSGSRSGVAGSQLKKLEDDARTVLLLLSSLNHVPVINSRARNVFDVLAVLVSACVAGAALL